MKLKDKVTNFVQYALVCSGADLKTLDTCASEKTKYVMIGIFICLTAVFAALSGGYALYIGFNSAWLAVPIGLLWGAFIFTIDRFIISTIRKRLIDSDLPLWSKVRLWFNEALKASPRILLAVMISLVISTPLELKYFAPEIQYEIDEHQEKEAGKMRNEALQDQDKVKQFETENQRLRNEIAKKEERRNQLQQQFNHELEGTGGTYRHGDGPVAKQLKLQFAQSQAHLDEFTAQTSTLIDENKQEIEKLLADRKKEVEQLIDKKKAAVGFLERFKVMNDLARENQSAWYAKIFISFLILVLECTPVLMKLLGSYGPYDSVLEAEEYTMILEQRRRISDLNQKTNHELYFNERVQMLIHTAEEQWTQESISNIKKLVESEINAAKEAVASKVVTHWKDKATQDIHFHRAAGNSRE
ncbi:MAG: DUF4407 domain-containing protein [Blastocatellia bacterium]